MGKKKRKKKNDEKNTEPAFALQGKTKRWIVSILLFATSLFFILARTHSAGLIGEKTYDIFFILFGVGYYLFPFVTLVLGITFLAVIRPRFLITGSVGVFFLFFSGFGFIEILGMEGGKIGALIASPLIKLFDIYASLVLLAALFLASLLLIIDSTPSFAWLARFASFFKKKPPVDAYTEETHLPHSEHIPESAPDALKKDPSGNETRTENDQKIPAPSLFSFSKEKKRNSPVPPFGLSYSGKPYSPPPLSLLDHDKGKPGVGDIKANANIIKRTLQNFGIIVEMDEISIGPSVTRYALKPAQGVKLSRIVGLQNDLSLALAAHPLRIEAPIPGKSLVGIEVPNSTRITIGLSSLLSGEEFRDQTKSLLFSLGRSVTGKPFVGNLSKMPHLLIAGATGSGKSVAIHAIIASFLYRNSPDMLRFILIDPKRVELTLYNTIPHLLTPVITDAKKAILALKWAAKEMERRYDIFETEKVRDISSYHKNIVEPSYARFARTEEGGHGRESAPELPERMPYIVIIIDELADIMSTYPRELEAAIVRLAQMSRATGLHLILSTQRPSVNVITGLIKANIPARMAFQVASLVDSRTILDTGGADKLLGAGDMLYLSGEMSKPVRLQSAFISEGEIKQVVKYLSKQTSDTPSELSFSETEQNKSSIFDALSDDEDDDNDDALYEEARDIVLHTGKASTTFLQRKLRVGYARAARLMDILEERGVVGPADGAKQRVVLLREEGYGTVDET